MKKLIDVKNAGEFIKAFREDILGESQFGMANNLDISISWISTFESGRKEVDTKACELIISVYKNSLSNKEMNHFRALVDPELISLSNLNKSDKELMNKVLEALLDKEVTPSSKKKILELLTAKEEKVVKKEEKIIEIEKWVYYNQMMQRYITNSLVYNEIDFSKTNVFLLPDYVTRLPISFIQEFTEPIFNKIQKDEFSKYFEFRGDVDLVEKLTKAIYY